MGQKLYDCFLTSFEWRELEWKWQVDGCFENDFVGIKLYIIPTDACNFKVAVRERKE